MTGDSLLGKKFDRSLASAHVVGCIVSENFDSKVVLGCYGRDVERSRRKNAKREMIGEAEG